MMMPIRTFGALPFNPREARVARASTPPSPLLSARMMSATYLIVTVSVTAQNSMERTPNTCSRVGAMPLPCRKVSRSA
jgi:hypothetical protein